MPVAQVAQAECVLGGDVPDSFHHASDDGAAKGALNGAGVAPEGPSGNSPSERAEMATRVGDDAENSRIEPHAGMAETVAE